MSCTGASKNTTACACQVFVPKKSKGTKCKTCGHRDTYHSDPTTSQDPSTPPATKRLGEKYATQLYRSLEASAVHETAREEMLQGFHPPYTQVNVCTSNDLYCIT
jgi:hypothetical protein